MDGCGINQESQGAVLALTILTFATLEIEAAGLMSAAQAAVQPRKSAGTTELQPGRLDMRYRDDPQGKKDELLADFSGRLEEFTPIAWGWG